MRIFASDWVRKMMDRLGMEEDIPIESRMVSKSIERAQKQVEGRNFEIRKHLLEYDDVMNKQRVAVYKLRRQILEGTEGRNYILRVIDEVVGSLIDEFCPEEADPEDWDRIRAEPASTAPTSVSPPNRSGSTGTPSTGPISRN